MLLLLEINKIIPISDHDTEELRICRVSESKVIVLLYKIPISESPVEFIAYILALSTPTSSFVID
jgi:hypothetical protein